MTSAQELRVLVDGWLAGEVDGSSFARTLALCCRERDTAVPDELDVLDPATAWFEARRHSAALAELIGVEGLWPQLLVARVAVIERTLRRAEDGKGFSVTMRQHPPSVPPQVLAVSRSLALSTSGSGRNVSEAGWHATLLFAFLSIVTPITDETIRRASIVTTTHPSILDPAEADERVPSPGREMVSRSSAEPVPRGRRRVGKSPEKFVEGVALGTGEEVGHRLGARLAAGVSAVIASIWGSSS